MSEYAPLYFADPREVTRGRRRDIEALKDASAAASAAPSNGDNNGMTVLRVGCREGNGLVRTRPML